MGLAGKRARESPLEGRLAAPPIATVVYDDGPAFAVAVLAFEREVAIFVFVLPALEY